MNLKIFVKLSILDIEASFLKNQVSNIKQLAQIKLQCFNRTQVYRKSNKKDVENIGLYDYLHLGALYFEEKQYDKAIEAFNMQAKIYDIAENYYYKALVYKATGKEYYDSLNMAKEKFLKQEFMYDVYTHQIDKVYKSQIEDELTLLNNKN